MAKYLITDSKLKALANAIRNRLEDTSGTTMTLDQMATNVARLGRWEYFTKDVTSTASTRNFPTIGGYTTFFYGTTMVPAGFHCHKVMFCGNTIAGRIDLKSGEYYFWRGGEGVSGTNVNEAAKFCSQRDANGAPQNATIYIPSPVGSGQALQVILGCYHD